MWISIHSFSFVFHRQRVAFLGIYVLPPPLPTEEASSFIVIACLRNIITQYTNVANNKNVICFTPSKFIVRMTLGSVRATISGTMGNPRRYKANDTKPSTHGYHVSIVEWCLLACKRVVRVTFNRRDDDRVYEPLLVLFFIFVCHHVTSDWHI